MPRGLWAKPDALLPIGLYAMPPSPSLAAGIGASAGIGATAGLALRTAALVDFFAAGLRAAFLAFLALRAGAARREDFARDFFAALRLGAARRFLAAGFFFFALRAMLASCNEANTLLASMETSKRFDARQFAFNDSR